MTSMWRNLVSRNKKKQFHPLLTIDNSIFLICLVVILICYLPVLSGYHQQDEWYAFGQQILKLKENSYLTNILLSFKLDSGHYVPLHYISLLTLYKLFGIAYGPYALISVINHLLVSGMVYRLTRLFFPAKIAALSMILFGLSASVYQGASWPMANFNTPVASFFGLLCLYYFIKGNLRGTVISLVIGLLFKEIIVGLIPFVLIITFFSTEKSWKKFLKPFCVLLLLYVLIRGFAFLNPQIQSTASVFTTTQTPTTVLLNLITLPFNIFAQSLFPLQAWVSLSLKIPTVLLGGLLLLFSSCAAIFAYIVIPKEKNKLFVSSIIFVVVNSLIYAFAPERSGIIQLVDSRNLYFVSTVAIPLLVVCLYSLFGKYSRLFYISIALLLLLNTYYLSKTLSSLVNDAIIRKEIIRAFHIYNPVIPEKLVVFAESNTSYYGLSGENKTLPFQSGVGQMLLVIFSQQRNYPPVFYKDNYLWEIRSEGYLEEDNTGFGYYRSYSKLLNDAREKKISIENIRAFSWNHWTQSLIDETTLIQNKLRKDI